MRTIDLTPLYRQTIGFDRMGQLLDQVMTGENASPGYPPYNIEKTGEDSYRISLAVAGFGEGDLTIEVRDQVLTVTARKTASEADKVRTYLHRGIAERGFERRFQLADHVRVEAADLENGLLHIDLKREVPEALRPRTISIGGTPKAEPRTIEA
ncbi:MAG: Hsp20 family protein [Pseudomonadota bacterium]